MRDQLLHPRQQWGHAASSLQAGAGGLPDLQAGLPCACCQDQVGSTSTSSHTMPISLVFYHGERAQLSATPPPLPSSIWGGGGGGGGGQPPSTGPVRLASWTAVPLSAASERPDRVCIASRSNDTVSFLHHGPWPKGGQECVPYRDM